MMYLLFLERLFMKKERVYEFDVVILERMRVEVT